MADEKKYYDNGEEVYYGVGSFLWEIVKVFFWAVVIIFPIRVFLLQPFFVQGASMEPTFDDGDYLIVNELGYKQTDISLKSLHFFTVKPFKELSRGDVVVFRYPRDPEKYFIKRVIGLPGEEIIINDSKVIVKNSQNPSGFTLDESYLPAGLLTAPNLTYELKNDEYFVMGDNRQFSHDSRAWGAVPESDIMGKVLIRAWPISKAKIF